MDGGSTEARRKEVQTTQSVVSALEENFISVDDQVKKSSPNEQRKSRNNSSFCLTWLLFFFFFFVLTTIIDRTARKTHRERN